MTAETVTEGARPVRPRERQVSEFTVLTRTVQEAGLMTRRQGWYWTRFVVLTLILAGLVTAFVLIGASWWQLLIAAALAVVLGQVMFLGHDAAHRQIFASGTWNEWASLVIAAGHGFLAPAWVGVVLTVAGAVNVATVGRRPVAPVAHA